MARGDSGVLGTVSMIVAFIVVGAFLYWLAVVSEPTEFAVAEEGEQAQAISLVAFSANPTGYDGLLVILDGIEVQEIFGAQAFLFALPDGAPYLVRVSTSPPTAGIQVVPGDIAQVTGRVEIMSDSVLQAWDAQGVFADPAHRTAVESFTSYIEAGTIQVLDPAGAATLDADPPAPGQN